MRARMAIHRSGLTVELREVVLKEMKMAGYHLIRSHDMLPQQYFLEFGL